MAFWDDKEYYGSQFVTLREPDFSIRAAKKQIMFNNDGLADFNKKYWTWKHEYRKRYTKEQMSTYGFKPIIEGPSQAGQTPELNAYMLTRDPLYHHSINISTGPVDLYSSLANFLQWNGYNYSIRKQELNVSGTIYNYQYVGYLENVDPAIPDDYTIGVGHFKSASGSEYTVTFPNTYGYTEAFSVMYLREAEQTEWSEIYIYIAPLNTVPFEVSSETGMVFSAIVPIKERGVMEEETSGMKKMLRKMGTSYDDFEEMLEETDDDGEAAVDNAYVANALPVRNPYEIFAKTYDSKEASVLSAAFLRELERKGFYEDSEDSETGVYTVTAEFADKWRRDHFKEQAYLAKALFKSFAYMSNSIDLVAYEAEPYSLFYIGNAIADKTSEHFGKPINPWAELLGMGQRDSFLTIRSGWLLATIGFNISIETKEGTVRGDEGVTDKRSQGDFHFSGIIVGPNTAENQEDSKSEERTKEKTWDSKGYDELVIRVQKNETQYQEMIITSFNASYGFEGKTFLTGLGYPSAETRLFLPHFILQELRFTEYATVYEHSFTLYAYMKKIVDFDWTTFIPAAIAAIVICVGTYGTGCSASMAMLAALQAVVIQAIWLQLGELLDPEILQVLKIVYALYTMNVGSLDVSSMTAENFLPLANQISGIAMKVYAIQEAKDMKEAAEQEVMVKSQENIDENTEGIDSAMVLKVDMSVHYNFNDSNNPEAYYAAMLGDGLYDYEQFYNVDGAIEIRKQVTSG